MCGIAGFVDTTGALDEWSLERALLALQHRGPDDCGLELIRGDRNTRVGLANSRLAILDLSAAGHQPMHDPTSGNWIVFNGEIYNFIDIRNRLESEGVALTSRSDTEVILKAYAQWGIPCLEHLRGMFAFALWDSQQRQLFMARDRLGEKPFYYHVSQGRMIFASEVRALLRTGAIRRELSLPALSQYLTFGSICDPLTIIEGVRSLPPAHYAIWKDGKLDQARYWDIGSVAPSAALERASQPIDTIADELSSLLEESVALRTVSDVPVAVFLSGGVDSSAIVGLLHRHGKSVATFSIVFPELEYSEAHYSTMIASRFRTDHHEITISQRHALEMVPDAIAAMDQPTVDGINTYVISHETRLAGLKVAISGLGSDEVFGGYSTFRSVPMMERFTWLFGCLPPSLRRAAAGTLSLFTYTPKADKIVALVGGEVPHPYFLSRMLFVPRQVERLLLSVNSRNHNGAAQDAAQILQRSTSFDPINRVSYLELRNYMANTLLRDTDFMSMAHGLEVRVPFVDHKLIEYMFTLAGPRKLQPGNPKHLLIRSLGGLLPDEVVQRRKRGFSLPFQHWLKQELRSGVQQTLLHEQVGNEFLDRSAVKHVWRSFLAGGTNWARPWAIYVLKKWLAHNAITIPESARFAVGAGAVTAP